MKKFRKVKYIKLLDLFGRPVFLSINGDSKYRSYFGAILSIFVTGLSLFFLSKLLISWFSYEYSSTITSSENFSVANLLKENKTILYEFNNQNYYIYFVVYAKHPNGTLNYKSLAKYLNIEYRYSLDLGDTQTLPLESESCFKKLQNDFLGIAYDHNEYSINQQNKFQMCVKNSFEMGLFPILENDAIWQRTLHFFVSPCKNESFNGQCASEEEIKEMLNYVTVQASIPKTIFDFKNTSQPINRLFKYEEYALDWDLKSIVQNEISPNYLFIDNGIINDDYILDSVNFNPDKPTLNTRTKNKDDNIIFQYKIAIEFQNEKFYIRNKKLSEILGSFGGIVNILFACGNIICYFYNNFNLKQTLIKTAFEFTKKTEEINRM